MQKSHAVLATVLGLIARISGQACGTIGSPTTFSVTDSVGTVQTSTWPNNYTANMDCYYLFTPASGFDTITLNFIVLDMEAATGGSCQNDYIAIYDGGSTSGQLLGSVCDSLSNAQSQSLATVQNNVNTELFLHFHSDGNTNVGQGFQLQYSAAKVQTAALSVAALAGIIAGCVIFVVLVAVIVTVVVLKKKTRIDIEREDYSDEDETDSDEDSSDSDESGEIEVSAENGERTVTIVPKQDEYDAAENSV